MANKRTKTVARPSSVDLLASCLGIAAIILLIIYSIFLVIGLTSGSYGFYAPVLFAYQVQESSIIWVTLLVLCTIYLAININQANNPMRTAMWLVPIFFIIIQNSVSVNSSVLGIMMTFLSPVLAAISIFLVTRRFKPTKIETFPRLAIVFSLIFLLILAYLTYFSS